MPSPEVTVSLHRPPGVTSLVVRKSTENALWAARNAWPWGVWHSVGEGQGGRLRARLMGRTYMVTAREVERYRREHLGKSGRPRREP